MQPQAGISRLIAARDGVRHCVSLALLGGALGKHWPPITPCCGTSMSRYLGNRRSTASFHALSGEPTLYRYLCRRGKLISPSSEMRGMHVADEPPERRPPPKSASFFLHCIARLTSCPVRVHVPEDCRALQLSASSRGDNYLT